MTRLTTDDYRACVSAAFRLAVTIRYAGATDVIYNVGPVCFWAYAEMTCGFIVVCVPCVPKILLETGIWRKMKMRLGLSVTTGTPSNTRNLTGSSAIRSRNMLSGNKSGNKSYLQVDDETELKDFGSESTEHLREQYVPKSENGIVRTTQVTVTQNSDISNGGDEARYGNHQVQWR